MPSPLTVAWISYFPIEWLPGTPAEVQALPRMHPAPWQRVLLEELEKFQNLRLHIVVLRKQFPRSLSFERNGVTFHLVKAPGRCRAPSLFWVDTVLIGRVLKTLKPDVVHAWGTEQGAALVAARLRYPYLVSVQGLMSWYRELIPTSAHGHVTAWLERYSLRRAPLVTAESNFPANYIRHHFAPAGVEQIEHVPDWMFHGIQREPRVRPPRFLFVGRFDQRKGVDLMLGALNQLVKEREFELVMVGGPIEPLYGQLRRSLSPELWRRVVFKDKLPPADVARELSQTTLMICSTRADTGPVAVKEAVVAGVPVVATAIGGIPDYVVPGKNGILFQSGDLAGCVQAIREACAHPLFGQGLVDASTLAAKREYLSPATMARQFWEAYQRVWSQSPAGRGMATGG